MQDDPPTLEADGTPADRNLFADRALLEAQVAVLLNDFIRRYPQVQGLNVRLECGGTSQTGGGVYRIKVDLSQES